MNLQNLLSKAKELFTQPEDQESLKRTEQHIYDLEAIKQLSSSDGGKALIQMLITDFFKALNKLFETREDRYISDLHSIINIINKLSVEQDLEAIRSYLEKRLN